MAQPSQIITFLILKSDNIENSRIDLKGIILQVPSNQINVTFIIFLPFNLVHMLDVYHGHKTATTQIYPGSENKRENLLEWLKSLSILHVMQLLKENLMDRRA